MTYADWLQNNPAAPRHVAVEATPKKPRSRKLNTRSLRQAIKLVDENTRKRYAALSKPITVEQVLEQSENLRNIFHGPRLPNGDRGTCWIYTSKAGGVYGRMKFNGVQIRPARFALALKLGCTVWDLEGYDAAHASRTVCVGGRCCNPAHLLKKTSEANRSWDAARERNAPRPSQVRERMTAALPDGVMPAGQAFFGQFLVGDVEWAVV